MDLPDEIVVDILRRVPVKSLVRFRCVSKSWRSLISDPTFVRTHISRMMESHISFGTASRIVLSRFADTLLSLQPPHENDDDGDGFAVAEELDLDLVKNLKYYVKGHCDGLLCLVIDNQEEKGLLVVYNPSIREHRILPLPPSFRSIMEPFGIGYDPCIDDYKIVAVPSRFCPFQHPGYIPRVEIFTLKSNSWRSLPDQDTPPYFVQHTFQTTNANGGLYWLFGDNDDAYTTAILRFDLVEEKFRLVPPVPDESLWSITWFGSLRDSLCVIHSQLATHINVWSTKDDQSWTKLITVPTLLGLEPSVYGCLYKLLCYTKTGALLMNVRGTRFYMYEPGENRLRQLAVRGVEHHLQETVYCESLVSPNCGNQDEDQAIASREYKRKRNCYN